MFSPSPGFAYDVGAPLPLAVGLGATVRFLDGGLFFGYRTGYLEGLAVLKPPTSFHHAIDWLDRPQWALAVSFVVLVAATLQASVMRRSAAVLAAGAAVFALAEAAVMIFASAALALVGVVRVVRLRGRERFVLAGALVVSALLVVLAGGPTSDALFGRGGTAGLARVAWEPVTEDLLPFQQAGPALVVVGIVPLTMVGAIAAYRRRSWGLGFLAAAVSFGLLEAALLQSPVPANDIRIFRLAQVVAIIGALSGVGALVGALRGARQLLATVAVVLLVFLPTSLPRATSNVHLALADLAVDDPSANNSGRHYRKSHDIWRRARSELGNLCLAGAVSADRGAPPHTKCARQRVGGGHRVAPIRPRSASVSAWIPYVGVQRRAALPAPGRPGGYGHLPPARHGSACSCSAAVPRGACSTTQTISGCSSTCARSLASGIVYSKCCLAPARPRSRHRATAFCAGSYPRMRLFRC